MIEWKVPLSDSLYLFILQSVPVKHTQLQFSTKTVAKRKERVEETLLFFLPGKHVCSWAMSLIQILIMKLGQTPVDWFLQYLRILQCAKDRMIPHVSSALPQTQMLWFDFP